jgi:outer membrane protein assembly factor BamB
MKKYTNKIIVVLISSFLCITAITGAVFLYNKKNSEEKPPEPIAQGDLSISPYWVFNADEDIISTPATNNKFLFVKGSASLYAVDILQKKVQWKVTSFTDRDLGFAPVVTNSSVIVVENGSGVAAYSIDSGRLLWKTSPIKEAGYMTASVQSMAFNSQYLYVGRFDWSLTAYNLKTGEIIWEHNLPGRTDSYVEANEDYVFVGAGDTLTIYQANYGTEVWPSYGFELWKKDDLGYAGPILLSGNTLYITDEENASLISLDVNTHKINWEKSYQGIIENYYYSCITETEKYLLIAAKKLMMVSKLDGEILWSTDDLGTLECPILLKDKIYIRNSRTTLYSIDKETGRETGQMLVQLNTRMKIDYFRSPIVVNGFLVVPFGDNRVFIYQP